MGSNDSFAYTAQIIMIINFTWHEEDKASDVQQLNLEMAVANFRSFKLSSKF